MMKITNVKITNANLDMLRDVSNDYPIEEIEYMGHMAPCVIFEEANVLMVATNLEEFYEYLGKDSQELFNTRKLEIIRQISKESQSLIDDAFEGYAEFELSTFASQQLDYEAFMLDPAAPTPFVDRLVIPGETKEELMAKIGGNITYITSVQRTMRARTAKVKACTTMEELKALNA